MKEAERVPRRQRRVLFSCAGEERPSEGGYAPECSIALVARHRRKRMLKELTNNSEREVPLELNPASGEHSQLVRLAQSSHRGQELRLPDSGWAFYERHRALSRLHSIEGILQLRQLSVTLE
jgi:hypothetical protein